MKTKELSIIKTEVHPIVERVQSFAIETPDDMREATQLLSELNKTNDRITSEREKVVKPLNEALRAERARWKPATDMLTDAISTLRRKITTFQTSERDRANAKAEKIAARVGQGKGKLQYETAVAKMEEIEHPEETISTDAGALTFRTVKKFEVVDLTTLPIEYHLADESKIRQAMKDGKELPGVRYFTEEVPFNTR